MSKPRTRKCYTCKKTGHLSKNCPEFESEEEYEVAEPAYFVSLIWVDGDGYNNLSVTVNIHGIDVFCQTSSATTCNLMAEDVWKSIAETEACSATLDTRPQGKLRSILGNESYPLGWVELPMMFSGVTYNMRWAVIPSDHMPIKACLGVPFTCLVNTHYDKDDFKITPITINPNPSIEELAQREIQKIKDHANKEIIKFMKQQKQYVKEQMEKVMNSFKEA